MHEYITLQSQDLQRVNLDQHLQAKLLQVPVNTNVLVSNYQVTQTYFRDFVVPKLSNQTIQMFVDVLKNVPYWNSGARSVMPYFKSRLTNEQLLDLAASPAYQLMRMFYESQANNYTPMPADISLAYTRSLIKYGNPNSSDVQRAILKLTPEEIHAHVLDNPKIIVALVNEPNFDKSLFKVAASSDNLEALQCVLWYSDDNELICQIIREKRKLFNTIDENVGFSKTIADWLTRNLQNIEISIDFKPLVKEEAHV